MDALDSELIGIRELQPQRCSKRRLVELVEVGSRRDTGARWLRWNRDWCRWGLPRGLRRPSTERTREHAARTGENLTGVAGVAQRRDASQTESHATAPSWRRER